MLLQVLKARMARRSARMTRICRHMFAPHQPNDTSRAINHTEKKAAAYSYRRRPSPTTHIVTRCPGIVCPRKAVQRIEETAAHQQRRERHASGQRLPLLRRRYARARLRRVVLHLPRGR